MTKPTVSGAGVRFYLVGRVPVRLEEREGGGVDVLAFNPLLGGFVRDARYYGAVQFEDMGRVRESDQEEFDAAVEALKLEYGQTA